MAKCTYKYMGKENLSYQELTEMVASEATDASMDILFALESKQETVNKKLEGIRKEFILQEKTKKSEKEDLGVLDESPDVEHDENTFTPQTFIDSEYFLIDGAAPLFRLSAEEYVNTMEKQFIESHQMSEEGARAWGEAIQKRWNAIAKNATDFHKLILARSDVGDEQWRTRVAPTVFKNIPKAVSDASHEIFRQVMLRNGRDKSGIGEAGIVKKNFNFSAELRGMNKTIRGHIDYMIIRDTGEIEIFQVKTSTEPYSQWSWAKKEKYRYELALLKQMLANNGIGTKDVRLNIIPVHLRYNEDFTGVESIEVEEVKSMDTHNMQYTFQKYDNVATEFLDSKIDATKIEIDSLSKATMNIQKIFPGTNVAASGVRRTAKDYVKRNWKNCHPKALPGGGYELTIPETHEKIRVSDSRRGARNDEFVKWVEDNLNKESEAFTGATGASRLIADIKNSFRSGFFTTNSHTESRLMNYLKGRFNKYLEHTTEKVNGKEVFTYEWSVVDSPALDAANVIAFKHNKTDQIDVFAISPMDPSTRHSFKNYRRNLLGAYLPDLNSENFTMESNFGNIEAIRTVALLNEALPQIEGNFKLGQLSVIGLSNFHSKMGMTFEFSNLLKQWGTIVKVVNRNCQDSQIQNNFKGSSTIKCVDPRDILMQAWRDIQTYYPDINMADFKDISEVFERKMLEDGSFAESLLDAASDEMKMQKLTELISRLRTMADEHGIRYSNPKELLRTTTSNDHRDAAIAQMYIAAMRAYSLYCGDLPDLNENFSQLEEYIMKPTSIGNTSARRVGFLTQQAIDNIRGRMIRDYMPKAMQIFKELYNDAGYTDARRMAIGDQASVYKNLYEIDENGENTLSLKNPYDDSSDLKPYERKFLKNILFEFYKIRCAMNNKPCDISGPNDDSLLNEMPHNYLLLPLQRASVSTRRQNWEDTFARLGQGIHELLTHPKEYLSEKADESVGLLLSDDNENRDYSIECLRAYNPYKRSEGNTNERNVYIDEKGANYFETNMENVFVDFMFRQVQCEEFNKLLVRINGIELALTLKGIDEGNAKEVDHAIKQIDDFVSLNVYNKPIMERTARIIDRVLMPIRRFVSTFYIANNPVAFVRDIIQGLEANFLRVATKYQTNLNAKDVAYGYQWVTRDSMKDIKSMSMFNQFNIKFGFSNFDAARVSERLKTGRGGILNPEHWLYWSLRAPDYLNRMVLFGAQLHHDGITEAYSLDEEGKLKYDWKKDKRFAVYASGDTSNAKYNEQRSLYYSMIREFNQDNPSLNLAYTDDLPDAYTPGQIRALKTLGESIYGAYDQSSKNKAENVAIGRNFMFFFTWMNGMIDNYFKRTQITQSELRTEQETDYEGNPLFFDADGSGNTTTTDTGLPVMKDVPIMVQGVFSTIGDAVRELYGSGWDMDAYKKDLLTNPVVLRNYKRVSSDLLMSLLMALLFGLWLTPAYKEHKTSGDGQMLAENLMIEFLYKGSSRAYDVFHGPAAVLQYFGESTSPATYRVSSKLARDTYNWLAGNRSLPETVWNSQAFFRSMQDSYKMWVRDNGTATA